MTRTPKPQHELMTRTYYLPPIPPKTPWEVGDAVHYLDNERRIIGSGKVVEVLEDSVLTDDGREFSKSGYWWPPNNGIPKPFPSVCKKSEYRKPKRKEPWWTTTKPSAN